MPASQFIFWPVTLPEDQAPNMQLKPDNNPGFNAVPPRTRTRKSAKQAAPKRPPQRGLGVAQLERLRMEQAGETEIVMQQQQQPPRVVLPQMLVGSYAAASQVGSGGGVLPGGFPVGAMAPPPPPGYMGRYLALHQAPEPPSTQIVPRVPVQLSTPSVDPVQCFSDQCEFCLRKKRLFGEGSVDNMDGHDYHLDTDLSATVTPSADQEYYMASLERRKVVPYVERQTREYQFFPTCGGSLGAETAFLTTVDASVSTLSTPSSTAAYPSQPIDLSLKLSF